MNIHMYMYHIMIDLVQLHTSMIAKDAIELDCESKDSICGHVRVIENIALIDFYQFLLANF